MTWLFVFLVLVSSNQLVIGSNDGNFVEVPQSQIVHVGSIAVFRCRPTALNAHDVYWTLNRTRIGANPPPEVTPDIIRENGNVIDTLTIVGIPTYNNSEIVCTVEVGTESLSTHPAILTVRPSISPTTAVPTTVTAPSTTATVIAAFTKGPSSLNVTVGEIAVFHCWHPDAFRVDWRLNGTLLESANFPPTISISHGRLPDDSGFQHSLTIRALLENNNTKFDCVLPNLQASSTSALLRVQGSLDAPANVRSIRNYDINTTTITWSPSFSLDLTNTVPDVLYCLEVYNITCEMRELLISDCNVSESSYDSSVLHPGYIYGITITPRNNVEDALNGASAHIEEKFLNTTKSVTIYDKRSSHVITRVLLTITSSDLRSFPTIYTLSLKSLDGRDSLDDVEINATRKEDLVVLDILFPLQPKRLWNSTILAYGCQSIVTNIVLSTHDIQNISVSFPFPGQVRVTGDFIQGSTATGILVSINNGTYLQYYQGETEVIVQGLSSGEYNVFVFTIEKNGLPFERASTRQRKIRIIKGSSVPVSNSASIQYDLYPISNGVCINCFFLDSNTSECVVVTQLKSSTLMNIESSHKLNRSGDTAHGCIEGVNLEDYLIGVISGKSMEQVDVWSRALGCTIAVCIPISVLASIFLCAGVIFVMIILKLKKRKSRTRCTLRFQRDLAIQQVEETSEFDDHRYAVVDKKLTKEGSHSSSPNRSPPPYTPHRADIIGCLPESAYTKPVFMDTAGHVGAGPPVVDEIPYAELQQMQDIDTRIPVDLPGGLARECICAETDISVSMQLGFPTISTENEDVGVQAYTNKLTFAPEKNKSQGKPHTQLTLGSLYAKLLPICSKWMKLGNAMSLPEELLDEIDTNNEQDEDCLQEMLEYYMQNCDQEHTWEEISSFLKLIDEEQLADNICSIYDQPCLSAEASGDNNFPTNSLMTEEETTPNIGTGMLVHAGFNAPTSLYRKERRHFISCQSISEECHDNLDANQPSSTEAMHVCHEINDSGGEIATVTKNTYTPAMIIGSSDESIRSHSLNLRNTAQESLIQGFNVLFEHPVNKELHQIDPYQCTEVSWNDEMYPWYIPNSHFWTTHQVKNYPWSSSAEDLPEAEDNNLDATQYEQNVVDNNICEEFDNNKDDSPQEETLDSIQRKLYIPKQEVLCCHSIVNDEGTVCLSPNYDWDILFSGVRRGICKVFGMAKDVTQYLFTNILNFLKLDIKIIRKYKKHFDKQSGRKKTQWWFKGWGDESQLQVLESKWEEISVNCDWRLWTCPIIDFLTV